LAREIEKWSPPERFKGRALGIFDLPEEKRIPYWQPWRDRWEKIEKRKEEGRKNKI
jgi:hypothetical protein